MMNGRLKAQSIIAESSFRENSMGICSGVREAHMSWPFRLKLTTDNMRWDSLKISPSQEFEEHILANLDAASRKLLDAHTPIEIFITDEDTCETYQVNLVKKESFWFEPLPDVGQKKMDSCGHKLRLQGHSSIAAERARKPFAYSIEPFRHIAVKRNLGYDQEIGLRWAGSKSVTTFNFSVLYAPRLDSHSFRT